MHIPLYVPCATIVGMAAFIFGFDTGSIGSILLMPTFHETFGYLRPTIEGIIVSSILIPAAIVSIGAGSISDRISRTYATSLGCGIYALGSLICAVAGLNTTSHKAALIQLFFGRCVAGAGEGVFLSAVTVYTIEVAPHHARGRVGCIVQLWISTGVLVGYFTCYGSLGLPSSISWRLAWIVQASVCTFLAVAVPFLPHSPRWLVHVRRFEDAKAVMRVLGIDEAELGLEEFTPAGTESSVRTERKGWRAHVDHFKAAFASELRGRTLLALFVFGVQQLVGIDGVLFYAPTLFRQAGLDSHSASFLASGVSGIVNLVFTIIGSQLSDKWGRRPTLIIGAALMGTAMTIIGVLYSLPSLSSAGKWVVIILIYLYSVTFVMTWAMLSRIWISESQPLHTRASVSSLALTINWMCNFIVAFTTPSFFAASPSGPYFFWAACAWIGAIVCAVFLPETKGQSIDGDEQNLALEVEIRWLREKVESSRCSPSLSRSSTRTAVGEESEKNVP